MSETEAERLARLETRADQQEKLLDGISDIVTALKTALDEIRGGKAALFGLLAAASVVGGLVVKFLPWSGK